MKISIITINYNNVEGLKRTIESVVNQTSKDYEYIIIDGGSTDGSVDVIKLYSNRIDYWESESDRGIYHAMNKGVKVATGEYVIFMNSGDKFYSNEIIADFIKLNPKEDILSGDAKLSTGSIMNSPENITFKFFYDEGLCHQTCFIRTELQKAHLYNENLSIVSDWEFFIKVLILENASYRKLTNIISMYDCNGISSNNLELHHKERKDVLEKYFSKRILIDYERHIKDDFRRLFFYIEKSHFHRLIYVINVLLIKFISIFTGAKWIRTFKLKESR